MSMVYPDLDLLYRVVVLAAVITGNLVVEIDTCLSQ